MAQENVKQEVLPTHNHLRPSAKERTSHSNFRGGEMAGVERSPEKNLTISGKTIITSPLKSQRTNPTVVSSAKRHILTEVLLLCLVTQEIRRF